MDANQILLTSAIGLVATLVTAFVTFTLTKRQEQRKHEREIAAKLSELNSSDRSVTQQFSIQYAQSCLVLEEKGRGERDRIFIPMGCRITLGRGAENHIVIDNLVLSKLHASFTARGLETFVEPLAPTNGLDVNGQTIEKPTRLRSGDTITVLGAPFKLTFLEMNH